MQFWAKPSFCSSHWQTFEQIEQEFGPGTVPQVFKLLESQPALLTHFWEQFYALVLHGDLPRVLKEMVGLVVAAATCCEQVRVVLVDSLMQQAAEPAALAAIAQGDYQTADVSHATRAVLHYAELAIANHTDSGAAPQQTSLTSQHQTIQALNDTGLEESEQLELIATVALFEQLCTVANQLQPNPD